MSKNKQWKTFILDEGKYVEGSFSNYEYEYKAVEIGALEAANKRIAKLEGENVELDSLISKFDSVKCGNQRQIMNLKSQNASLLAQVNELKEALDKIDEIAFQNGYHSISRLCVKYVAAADALSKGE